MPAHPLDFEYDRRPRALRRRRHGFAHSIGLLCLLALFNLGVMKAAACSVPVFRYALDHWPGDSYRLELPAKAATDPALAEVLRNLGDDSPFNLQLVPAAEPDSGEARLLFPLDRSVAWSGPLDAEGLGRLTESPARSEIVKRLLEGQSAVWILIESGQAATDDAEASRIQKRLRFLETVTTLPVIDPADPASRLGPGPALKIGFSLLRLAVNDARETVLRKMLVAPAGLAASETGGPIAAVVFGRGRVLGAWPIHELDDASIDEACLYLLGACSCQVKRLNPGWDLLLSVRWDRALEEIAAGSTGVAELADQPSPPMEADDEPGPNGGNAAETVTIQPEAVAAESGSSGGEIPGRLLLFALAGAGALFGLVILLRKGR